MSTSFKIGSAISHIVGLLWGTKSSDATQGETVDVTDGAAHVAEIGIPGVGVSEEIADQTTTPTQKDFPSGLLELSIDYFNLGSAAGKVLYVVFDALDDADAATKLGAAGSREVVRLDVPHRPWGFSESSPCYRVDVASDAASETGDTLVVFSGKVAA